MRIRDLNWMQLEAYLETDDRIVLPVGSTEQHAYLSLETDNILAERASVDAAEPLGIPVLPVIAVRRDRVHGVSRAARRCRSPRSSPCSRTSWIRCSARDSAGCSS